MNKKGFENFGLGSLILVAVALIVGLTLLTGSISDNVATLTTTQTSTNQQITFPTNTTTVTLYGQAASGVTVSNASSGTTIGSGNYTISNYVVSNGQLKSTIGGKSNLANSPYAGQTVNITYTYEPFGYDTNSGGRTIASLIIVFCAIALLVVSIVPIIKDGLFDF